MPVVEGGTEVVRLVLRQAGCKPADLSCAKRSRQKQIKAVVCPGFESAVRRMQIGLCGKDRCSNRNSQSQISVVSRQGHHMTRNRARRPIGRVTRFRSGVLEVRVLPRAPNFGLLPLCWAVNPVTVYVRLVVVEVQFLGSPPVAHQTVSHSGRVVGRNRTMLWGTLLVMMRFGQLIGGACRCRALVVMALAVMFQSASQAQSPRQMEIAARAGPWPVISQIIGYRGRVWFANSVKGRNHNSADLYSLDASSGDVRYERHLFSQDAGDPVVHNGLLYWPYEDTRASLGWGGIDVTNGDDWRYLLVPTAQMFHVHTLAEWRGGLLAVTSAWRAGLQYSKDGGLSWSELYDHDTAPGKVSRIGTFVVAGDQAVAHLRGAGGVVRLVRWSGGAPVNVSGWPQRQPFYGLTAHKGDAYLVKAGDQGSTIWVVEGESARPLTPPDGNWEVWDLASDGDRLWAVTRAGKGGELWSSAAGETWRLEATYEAGVATNVAAANGAIYVGGAGDDGRGILWALMPERAVSNTLAPRPALPQPKPAAPQGDFDALAARLDEVLGDRENFFNHGRGALRKLVFDIARSDPPDDLLASRLASNFPAEEVPLLGGSKSVSVKRLGEWILLWGMGLSAKGRVPLHYLDQEWDLPAHRSEKYFHPTLMALWTLVQTGDNDLAVIEALVARLDRKDDPRWLQGDVIGTLTGLTAERFGYDTDAWRTWWAKQRR